MRLWWKGAGGRSFVTWWTPRQLVACQRTAIVGMLGSAGAATSCTVTPE